MELLRGVVYKYTNIINNKVYIGQTIDEEKRKEKWREINSPYAGSYINRAREKYGIASFSYEVIIEIFDEDRASLKKRLNTLEIKYIAEYRSSEEEFGYNLTTGGGASGRKQIVTNEARKNMSIAQKGIKKPMSEEGKRNISEAHKGKKSPWRYKKVCQLDKETGELIKIWDSLTEAAASFGDNRVSNLTYAIRGKYRHKFYRGYKWVYYEDFSKKNSEKG